MTHSFSVVEKMEIDKAARYTREMTLTADCEREQKEKNQVR